MKYKYVLTENITSSFEYCYYLRRLSDGHLWVTSLDSRQSVPYGDDILVISCNHQLCNQLKRQHHLDLKAGATLIDKVALKRAFLHYEPKHWINFVGITGYLVKDKRLVRRALRGLDKKKYLKALRGGVL
jgi:hypothetical protein